MSFLASPYLAKCVIWITCLTSLICWSSSADAQNSDSVTDSKTEWDWQQERCSIFNSFINAPTHYSFKLIKLKNPDDDIWPDENLKVQIHSPKGEKLSEFVTHRYGSFVVKDHLLVRIEYSFIASGCFLHVFDLEKQKPVWSRELKGLGPVSHSEYGNRVTFTVDKDRIVVYGRESDGHYIEVRALGDGRLQQHRLGKIKGRFFDELDRSFDHLQNSGFSFARFHWMSRAELVWLRPS